MRALLNSAVSRHGVILQHRMGRMLFICCMVSAAQYAQTASAGPCEPAANERKVSVRDYHAVGDGKTDDGPAIRAALKAVIEGPKPAALEFEQGKTYRITTFEETFALRVMHAQKLTLRGNGAELLLLPPNKVLHLSESSDVNVCGLIIDYSPLPFTQGMVVSTNPKTGTFDIQIEEGFDIPEVDSATVRDNSEVWEFGMPYKQAGEFEKRVNIKAVHATAIKSRVRIHPADPKQWQHMIPNRTHLVMPLPGKGQTGNYAFQIHNNERLHIENVRVYAVPKFSFHIAENLGPINFINVEQRTRPNTKRVMTGWRDVFHVKDNRAPLLWDGCFIEGAFDDAFNLSAMYQQVAQRSGQNSWKLRNAGAGEAPIYMVGDRIQAIDIDPERKLLGEAKIVAVTQRGKETEITLDTDIPLKTTRDACAKEKDGYCGSRVINLDAANENSVIRNCTITGSMRLRSKTTFEKSKLDGFLQIASSPAMEGPSPTKIIIRDNDLDGTIRIGADANSNTTRQDWHYGERWASGLLFHNNRIKSVFKANGASIDLFWNEINWPKSRKFEFKNCGPIRIRNLRENGLVVRDPLGRISMGKEMNIQDVIIKNQ